MIDGIKKQIDLMNKDNSRFRNMVETNDGKFTKTTKNITEIKKKSVQAKSDKKELFRDLATYESNFNERSNLDARMVRILQNVQKTKTLINREYRIMSITTESCCDYDKIDRFIDEELQEQNLMDKIDQPVEQQEKVVGMLNESQINHIFENL